MWVRAINVPGLGALTTGRYSGVLSVSCASPGNCAAGGDYEDMPHGGQGFVVREQNGVWLRAITVPGLGALNKGGSWGQLLDLAARKRAQRCGFQNKIFLEYVEDPA